MWRKSSVSTLIGAALTVATSSYGQENWFGAISGSDCDKFSKLSVAFADDSSRSPASMFGHTFLVLHNEARPEQDSMVVEFVGDTSGSDIAAMRALFWSIPGKFIIRRFAYKLLEYGREGRDVRVWRVGEVPANCEETLQSFMRDDLEYSFLRKNCSWHTERLACRFGGRESVGPGTRGPRSDSCWEYCAVRVYECGNEKSCSDCG